MQAVIEKLRDMDAGHQFEMLMIKLGARDTLKRIQTVILLLLSVWIAASIASLLWSLWSGPSAPEKPAVIINPPGQIQQAEQTAAVNQESMLGLGLFGDPVASNEEVAVQTVEKTERDGIEQGARETRLDLILVGTLVTSSDGLGTAVIESKKDQMTYAVGDALPVGTDVTLAKVLPKQVVLDNAGKFELLTLFEENPLAGEIRASATETGGQQLIPRNEDAVEEREFSQGKAVVVDSVEATALAAQYRE